jgi:hypothetical protein
MTSTFGSNSEKGMNGSSRTSAQVAIRYRHRGYPSGRADEQEVVVGKGLDRRVQQHGGVDRHGALGHEHHRTAPVELVPTTPVH